eukprot:TRINITY_DN4434_c0_g1_i2.p1 TRINITY_DN4434_c0_g1~~TRINITY_DN4434_c0_g1_i2.p1  ORF type:complete len:282 (-),score=49.41 TRINITY_DN4434_c0_g1_i2:24-869(-)
MKLTYNQATALVKHKDSPYIRALGFLYLRYSLPPRNLWNWFSTYVDDEEEISLRRNGGATTIGKFVRGLIKDNKFLDTILPRIPVPIEREMKKSLEEHDGSADNGKEEVLEKDRDPSPRRNRSRSRDRRDRSRSRSRDRKRRDRSRSRSRDRYRSRRDRYQDRDRPRSRSRDRDDRRDRDRDRGRDRDRDRDRDRNRDRRDRSRSGSRERGDKSEKKSRSHSPEREAKKESLPNPELDLIKAKYGATASPSASVSSYMASRGSAPSKSDALEETIILGGKR